MLSSPLEPHTSLKLTFTTVQSADTHTLSHTHAHKHACTRVHRMVISCKLTFAYEWPTCGSRVVWDGRTDVAKVTILAIVDKPGYNDIGLCDTPPIPSDILWY